MASYPHPVQAEFTHSGSPKTTNENQKTKKS